jgi:hypothetical protein
VYTFYALCATVASIDAHASHTSAGIQNKMLSGNPIVVIAPTLDSLAKRTAVPLTELSKRRFILREKGSETRMTGDEFFSKQRSLKGIGG